MVNERKYPDIAELAAEIARCGRCGFCQSVCPVYQVTAHEEGVARGRNMFAKELLSGTLDISRENEAFFSECLLCRACVEMCFSSVKTDEIVLAGRRETSRMRGISPTIKFVFAHLLPDHRRLGRAVRRVAGGKTLGAIKLAQVLDIFGWYGGRLKRLDEVLSEIPRQFLSERLALRKRAQSGRAPLKNIHYFIGCGMNFVFPDAGEATTEVLEKLGYEISISDNCCCGLPAYAHGALDEAAALMMKNLNLFSDSDAPIITDCSSCASFLKKYPAIIDGTIGDQALVSKANAFAARVRDVAEILAESATALAAAPVREKSLRVTFHDPCHLSRHQKLSLQARQALRSLPNIEFVEMKEADWCCGGAGAFAFEHPDLSLRILERKMRNIEKSGADIVATTCPSCMMQLQSGINNAREEGLQKVKIKHLTEIVNDIG